MCLLYVVAKLELGYLCSFCLLDNLCMVVVGLVCIPTESRVSGGGLWNRIKRRLVWGLKVCSLDLVLNSCSLTARGKCNIDDVLQRFDGP